MLITNFVIYRPMILFTNDENRWANDIPIVLLKNTKSVTSIYQQLLRIAKFMQEIKISRNLFVNVWHILHIF